MSDTEKLARLVVDARTLVGTEAVAFCEACGTWLLPDDDYVSGDDVSGCWAAMTDAPSKRERPCYAYRVGKDDARECVPAQADTRRMAETGTGSGRSPGGPVGAADAPDTTD